jgi:hypothetical protein
MAIDRAASATTEIDFFIRFSSYGGHGRRLQPIVEGDCSNHRDHHARPAVRSMCCLTHRPAPILERARRVLSSAADLVLSEMKVVDFATRVAVHLSPRPLHFTQRGAHMTRGVGLNRNVGMLLLGIWLILTGLSGLVALGLPPMLMAVLALIAGILVLIGR